MNKGFMVVMLACLSIATMCEANDKVITAAADPYPPFVDPADPQEGLSLAIIRAAYKTQGYAVKMEFVPWARAKSLTIEGKYDILPDTWMDEEQKKKLHFSDPYAVNIVKFIKNADDPFEYTDFASLKGKRIGTIRGYNYSVPFIQSKDFEKETVADFMINVRKLIGKRIDLTLEDEIVARLQITQNDPDLLPLIKFLDKPFESKELYVSAGRANPRHVEIIDAFNKGLAEIKSSGEFAKIISGYGVK